MSLDADFVWSIIKPFAESKNTHEIINYVRTSIADGDNASTILLLRTCIRCLMFREWENRNLDILESLIDILIEVAIKDCELDPGSSDKIDQLNIIYYNMSSNFAGCWNDGFIRTSNHYLKGFEYALKAIDFRVKLQKPARPFYFAYWTKGIHQLYLGQHVEAKESFEKSLEFGKKYCLENQKSIEIDSNGTFEVLLGTGYLEIVLILLGEDTEIHTLQYNQVISAFRQQLLSEDQEVKEDAKICIDQLEYCFIQLINK